MATVVKREKRERSAIGKLIKWAFIGFNILMLVWIVGGLQAVSNMEVHSTAEQAGRAIGSALGVASLLSLWAVGDIILGILVLLTRGDKIITEEFATDFSDSRWGNENPSGNFSNADELIARMKSEKGTMSPQTSAQSASTANRTTFGRR